VASTTHPNSNKLLIMDIMSEKDQQACTIAGVSHRAINVNFGNPESIKVPENWKDAKGINASYKETNSTFAERDYKCECETGSEPLAVVEGYHIWWCKSHHQPLYKCDRERVL